MLAEEKLEAAAVEKDRMRYIVAATNPRLYQLLFEEKEDEEGVVWTTPQTPEEVDELLALISEQQVEVEEST